MIRGVIFGLIGGVIGAAAWVIIGVLMNAEVGIVAWGIGGLVGFAVGLGTPEREESPITGVIAVLIAVVTIVAGKYLVVSMQVDNYVKSEMSVSDEVIPYSLAWDVVFERESQGTAIDWPGGVEPDEAESPDDFPADVWAEAQNRLSNMSAADMEAFKSERLEETKAVMKMVGGDIKIDAFISSFGLFDILWFFLAIGTAYKLGAGMLDDG